MPEIRVANPNQQEQDKKGQANQFDRDKVALAGTPFFTQGIALQPPQGQAAERQENKYNQDGQTAEINSGRTSQPGDPGKQKQADQAGKRIAFVGQTPHSQAHKWIDEPAQQGDHHIPENQSQSRIFVVEGIGIEEF